MALDEFSDQPLTGVGEGSYPFRYYESGARTGTCRRRTALAFSVIAELGAVGVLLF